MQASQISSPANIYGRLEAPDTGRKGLKALDSRYKEEKGEGNKRGKGMGEWVEAMGLVLYTGRKDGCCATKFVVGFSELVYCCLHLDLFRPAMAGVCYLEMAIV